MPCSVQFILLYVYTSAKEHSVSHVFKICVVCQIIASVYKICTLCTETLLKAIKISGLGSLLRTGGINKALDIYWTYKQGPYFTLFVSNNPSQ